DGSEEPAIFMKKYDLRLVVDCDWTAAHPDEEIVAPPQVVTIATMTSPWAVPVGFDMVSDVTSVRLVLPALAQLTTVAPIDYLPSAVWTLPPSIRILSRRASNRASISGSPDLSILSVKF